MKRWIVASALALAAQPSLADAPKAPAKARSDWAQAPADADLIKLLPAETQASLPAGRAIMRCVAHADGAVGDCALLSDTPPTAGYGKALLALAPQFKLTPAALAALPPDKTVIIPFDHFPADKEADWLRKPRAEDLMAVWPKGATGGGKATISCLVSVQGALYDCVVLSESPAGQHFGGAAIALTPQFLMRPAMLNGQPVISQVRMPINWQGEGGGGGFGSHKVAQPAMAWLEAPSYAQMIASYPKKAKADGVVGRATLNCEFTSAGRVEHCQTVTEEPRSQGFADAAKVMAKQFRAPPLADGKSWSGVDVQLPFVWDRSMQTEIIPAVGKPMWASLPSAEATASAFGALSKSVEGTVRVMLTCTVQPGGTVGGCTVASENPAGKGVGEAALALAPHFRLTTWTMEGLPTIGATINIPLRYEGKAPEAVAKP